MGEAGRQIIGCETHEQAVAVTESALAIIRLLSDRSLRERMGAELLVQALDVVLDGVRGQDERLGHLCSRQAAGEEGGDLALASGRAERLGDQR